MEKYNLSSSNKMLNDIWRLISDAEFFDCIARIFIRSKKLIFLVREISWESDSGEKDLATAESAGIQNKYLKGKTFKDKILIPNQQEI